MSLTAFGLLFAAAVLHAGWNLLLKRAGEKYIFTWWALVVGSGCFLPLLLIGPPLPARAWPFAIGSALLSAAYYTTLASAYGRGDISLVYPIARGTAPALLAVWSVLFLHEHPRLVGVLGLTLLVCGLLVVGSSSWWAKRMTVDVGSTGVAMALLVAFLISAYSIIDGAAVQSVSPIKYTVLVFGLTVVLTTPPIVKRYRWRIMVTEWRAHWPRIALAGCLTVVAYMLVLGAYALAPVSYAGAVREMSIIFAALAGWRWLGESFGASRMVGAILIFSGILIITVAG